MLSGLTHRVKTGRLTPFVKIYGNISQHDFVRVCVRACVCVFIALKGHSFKNLYRSYICISVWIATKTGVVGGGGGGGSSNNENNNAANATATK